MESIDLRESIVKGFGRADEVRTFDKGRLELFHLGDGIIGRATFEPGWKWSTCLKPIAKTASCEAAHLGYQIAGTMHIVTDSGRQFDIHKGDFFSLPPGHDGWVVGDESVVIIDFQGMTEYAKTKDAAPLRDRKH